MPAVNPQDQHGQSNVTLTSVSSGQAWLIFNITVALAALSLALALRFSARFRQNGLLTQRFAGLADPGQILQRHQFSGVQEKSRVVSNDTMAAPLANHDTNFAQLEADGTLELKHTGGSLVWSQDGVIGTLNEVSSTTGQDMTIPQPMKPPPPPVLPLTPPCLSADIFSFEERRLSTAVSTNGDWDSTFFHQPNPDYGSTSTSTSTDIPQHSESPTAPAPRRRSYTKMLTLGPPQPVSAAELDSHSSSFAPSPFPSSNPSLPLAPHELLLKEIDVQGEIISVTDDAGAGWKRHTRVYGGGVCLACLASGGEGGFYGDKVRPEERR